SMVATFIAAQWPRRVRRLVLSGAPALDINPGWKPSLKPWVHLRPGPELNHTHRFNLAALMLAQTESIDDLALELHAANLPRDRMRSRRISRTDIVRRTLPDVRCPVFGTWGEEDVLYRCLQDAIEPDHARAHGFCWLRLIPGAGHWVQFERPHAYDEALAAALAG